MAGPGAMGTSMTQDQPQAARSSGAGSLDFGVRQRVWPGPEAPFHPPRPSLTLRLCAGVSFGHSHASVAKTSN